MKFKSTELLHVFLDSEGEQRKLGRLAFNNRQILFEYDEPFLASGIELSPIHLPLRPGVFRANTAIYDGLFGLFNDSVPEGWGLARLKSRARARKVSVSM